MANVALWVLSSPRVERDGTLVTMDTRKAVALLTYLVVERRSHSRDTLAALLWPDYDQPHARAALRRTLSTLVKALGEDIVWGSREAITVHEGASLWADVAQFQACVATVKAHQHPVNDLCPACRKTLTTAVTLYHDDFLAGFHLRDSAPFEDWQFTTGQALRRDLGTALARLMRDAVSHGQLDTALQYARRWLSLDRLNEQAHRYLMRLYAWTGQQSAALLQYRECLQVLDQELGVAPLDVTTRLYEAIKQQRLPGPPTRTGHSDQPGHPDRLDHPDGLEPLTVPERPRPPSPSLLPSPPAASPDHVAAVLDTGMPARNLMSPPSQMTAAPDGTLPLVGRAPELRQVLDAYAVSATAGHLLVIEGEAGIGKTRLAEELATHARGRGAAVILVRCYEGEASLPYAPIASALRVATLRPELATPPNAPPNAAPNASPSPPPDLRLAEAARLVPEIRDAHPTLPAAGPLDSAGAQVRFFEGVRQVLLHACQGAAPGILCFDDMQWADAASLDLLAYLVRRLREHPICLVLTWRSTEVAPSSLPRRVLADAQRVGYATHVTLERLDRAAIQTWVGLATGQGTTADNHDTAHIGDTVQDRLVAERIYTETEGLPFFVSEYVRALTGGTLATTATEWHVPGGVQDLLRSRLRAVDDASLQVLTAAAILGRSFDFDAVHEVSGRSAEETLVAVEHLLSQGLVTEFGDGTTAVPQYDFAHNKLRTLVLEQTSLARRHLLHRRAAAALEQRARSRHDDATVTGQIAQHALLAGDTQMAAEYFKRAGDRARALYAHADALRHYEQARALDYADPASLHEAIGDVLLMLANYGPAITSYELAAATTAPENVWRLELKLGRVYARRGEWGVAQSYLESAFTRLETLPEIGPAERSTVCAEWSLVARSSGRGPQAQALAERTLALAEEARDDRALAQAHNLLGMLARDNGDTATAIAHLEQSLVLAEHLADPGARAAALNNLALALGENGERERAIGAAEAALALAVTQGDRHHEAALLNNLADLLHAAGRTAEAMHHLTRAVTIFAEIKDEAGALQPGVWMLTDW